MPSMHVAWSTIAGIFLTVVFRRRWVWLLAVLHPTLMAFTVIVTANHFVLDVVAGMVVLGVSIAVEQWLMRRNACRAPLLYRPEHTGPRLRPSELDMAYSD